jgi:hypothetical protein
MLLVGIDWAEAEHAACLLEETGAVRRRLRVPHSAAGLRRLRAAVAAAEPEAVAVHVAVERSEGLLVEALVAAGYRVYALNPKAVERYRGRTRIAGPKSDPADAELLARILLTDRDRHRPLRPSSPQVAVIRALAHDAFLAALPALTERAAVVVPAAALAEFDRRAADDSVALLCDYLAGRPLQPPKGTATIPARDAPDLRHRT